MNFREEMIKKHSHAEIENEINPAAIVYKEEDVIELLKLVRDKTLEWAKLHGRVEVIEELNDEDKDRAYRYINDMEVFIPGPSTKIFKKFLEI